MGNLSKNFNRFVRPAFLIVIFCLPMKGLFAQACVITFDSSASSSGNTSALSFPLTVSGSNRLLVVQVDVEANDGASSITGATYGSAPMSQVLQTIRSSGGNGRQATFILTAPALGSNNVVVNLAGNKQLEAGAIDYNGVDQTTPVGAVSFIQDANSQSHSITLTTTTNNSLIASTFMWYPNNTTISSLGAAQTQRWIQLGNNGSEGDDKLTLIAGSTSMDYTLANSKPADIQAVEIRPCAIVASTPTNTPTNTATATTTSTITNTPTQSATATPSNTGTLPRTNTPTNTPTNTATPAITSSPTFTPTSTPTNVPVNTPTVTPTPQPTSTFTPTPTPYPVYRVWPNPFTPALSTDNLVYCNIPPPHGAGELMILDMRRRPVRTISFRAGVTPVWDGKDASGRIVRGGLYLYLLTVDGQAHRGTIAVLK